MTAFPTAAESTGVWAVGHLVDSMQVRDLKYNGVNVMGSLLELVGAELTTPLLSFAKLDSDTINDAVSQCLYPAAAEGEA